MFPGTGEEISEWEMKAVNEATWTQHLIREISSTKPHLPGRTVAMMCIFKPHETAKLLLLSFEEKNYHKFN